MSFVYTTSYRLLGHCGGTEYNLQVNDGNAYNNSSRTRELILSFLVADGSGAPNNSSSFQDFTFLSNHLCTR